MKTRLLIVFLLLASLAGCSKPDSSHSWYRDDWRGGFTYSEAEEYLNDFNNVILVCITGDQVKTELLDVTTSRSVDYIQFDGTVVRSYKGNWNVGERITFTYGLDYTVTDKTMNTRVGELIFVLTDTHTNTAFAVDTGDFESYSTDTDRLFQALLVTDAK